MILKSIINCIKRISVTGFTINLGIVGLSFACGSL